LITARIDVRTDVRIDVRIDALEFPVYYSVCRGFLFHGFEWYRIGTGEIRGIKFSQFHSDFPEMEKLCFRLSIPVFILLVEARQTSASVY